MNARTKSILIIVATLLVGITIGALATGTVLNQRVETLQALREDGSFMYFLERTIEPTDEQQRQEIQNVLRDASQRQREIRRSIMEDHRSLFAEVRSELDAILTDEQKEKLRTLAERERKMRSEKQGRPGFMRRPGQKGRKFAPDSSMIPRRPFGSRRPGGAPPDSGRGIE